MMYLMPDGRMMPRGAAGMYAPAHALTPGRASLRARRDAHGPASPPRPRRLGPRRPPRTSSRLTSARFPTEPARPAVASAGLPTMPAPNNAPAAPAPPRAPPASPRPARRARASPAPALLVRPSSLPTASARPSAPSTPRRRARRRPAPRPHVKRDKGVVPVRRRDPR